MGGASKVRWMWMWISKSTWEWSPNCWKMRATVFCCLQFASEISKQTGCFSALTRTSGCAVSVKQRMYVQRTFWEVVVCLVCFRFLTAAAAHVDEEWQIMHVRQRKARARNDDAIARLGAESLGAFVPEVALVLLVVSNVDL